MRYSTTFCFSLFLLSSCSNGGLNLYVSDEKTAHYRTFARITDAEETEKVHFEVKKRDRQVMAEKEFYKEKNTSMSVAAGKHKDKNWSAGMVFRYGF